MQKTASKNSISNGSYEFFKSGSQYNYYTRVIFKSQYLKMILGTFFDKTMHGRGPKLGSYVPLIVSKRIFPIFMGKNVCMFC